MKFHAMISTVMAALSLTGCSIHPLPDDVIGLTTAQIVSQIRCEARDAAIDALINFLASNGRALPGRPADAKAGALALKYRDNRNAVAEFRPEMLDSLREQEVLRTFYNIGVAYSFQLTMTEENNLSAGAVNTRSGPAASLFKLGFGGEFTRKRDNKRSFTLTDTFDFYLHKMNQRVYPDGSRECDRLVKYKNYIYPLAGEIGLKTMVVDFLDLAFFQNLGGEKNGPPTLADTLTFTTVIDASATPSITFLPTGTALKVTDAAITADVKRTDSHQVIVGIALPPGPHEDLDSLRSYFSAAPTLPVRAKASQQPMPRSSLAIGARVIGGGGPSELLALAAVDQQRQSQFQLTPAP